MAGKGKNKISYIDQDEPAFLKRFKQEAGIKDGPSVKTKFEDLPDDSDDDAPEKDEEQPAVVVLQEGQLTAEEAEHYRSAMARSGLDVDEEPADGKIRFRKADKRKETKSTDLSISSKKDKGGGGGDGGSESDEKKEKEKKDKEREKKKEKVAVKNSSLLSFGDDEEEDY